MARRRSVVLGAALFVAAANLRIAIAAISPVLTAIQSDLGLSGTMAGLLTTVPIGCFGAFAFLTPRLTRRLGMERLLCAAFGVLTAGILVRLAPSVIALFAGTALIGAAIALGNVLMPGLVKRGFPTPHGAAAVTGLYSMGLYIGAALAAGLTVPIEHAAGVGWRPALAVWAIPAVAALLVWMPAARRRRPPRPAQLGAAPPTGSGPGSLWSDPVAWAVTAFMGLQGLGYYSMLAWTPALLESHHMARGQAGWMLAFSSFPGMAASLTAPVLARRMRSGTMVVATVALCAIAYGGLLADPMGATYAWMAALGLGSGTAISLALGFIVDRAADAHVAAHLSTMAQGVGYLLACLGPFALGAIHSLSGGWTVPLLVLAALLVPELVVGVAAARDRLVLDGGEGDAAAGAGPPRAGSGRR